MNTKRIEVTEQIQEIATDKIIPFSNSPFKVKDDQEMMELVDSIKRNGIITPIIIRRVCNDQYEVISGHRRLYAMSALGEKMVPAIVRDMADEEAQIALVDSNLLQREHILFSEKAAAYKMRYDAMKRKAGRKNGGQVDHQKGKKTIEILAEEMAESSKQVQRYIKLTELIPQLMKQLDDGILSFTPAEQLAYLDPSDQKKVIEAMEFCCVSPSLSQAIRLKKLGSVGKLSFEKANQILGEIKKGDVERVEFKRETLLQFFPTTYSAERMKQEIIKILKKNKEHEL